MDAGRHAAGELREAAGRRELERREGEPPGPEGQRQPGAEGVRQPRAGGADSAARRAELPGRAGRERSSCGSATPTATCSGWASPAPVYFLVAGRWFSAPDFTGPWTFATPTLPADFKQIPLEHERSRVLASVPGTTQAAEAVLLAQIPQTARVSKTVQAPEVAYQGGTPEFQPIEKTTVQRAVNTDKDILKVGDLYYMCFQGVWFMSKTPTGPVGGHRRGAEADLRDSGELAVPCRHLRHGGGVERRRRGLRDGGGVHGRDGRVGLRRVGHRLLLPAVRRVLRRCTRTTTRTIRPTGSAPPTTRGPARTRAARWPTVRTAAPASAQRYNPRTGTYSRGAVAYGPYGARGAAQAYNPRTGTYGATRQGSNVYGSWGTTGVAARRSVGHHLARTPTTSPATRRA